LAQALGGVYVLLDDGERTARVVYGGDILDFAEFRAPTLEADLKARDFTVNAMAVALADILQDQAPSLIDPWGGREDLSRGVLRLLAPENFAYDPLRLLRAYRFAATHGFSLTPGTVAAIRQHLPQFPRVAGERVRHELLLLLAAPHAAPVLKAMDEAGLLGRIFPELDDAKGVEQNGYHHLDVFRHSLETAAFLEDVLERPGKYFIDLAPALEAYARIPGKAARLKLAALFHDAGKPHVQELRPERQRYTFYHHERVGQELFAAAARRLRLSQAETKTVVNLIAWHMRPFLLLPVFRRGAMTVRALGRLVRAARDELPGLWALAMADSLAGQGPQKPADSEAVLARLADQAYLFLKERLEPQARQPRLITGDDLIRHLGLAPGPRFRHWLTQVEEAQWEGLIHTREEALDLVRGLL
jgi:poly(A) polymerase